MSAGRTAIDKIWDEHVVAKLGQGCSLLHVDRHLLHDLSGTLDLEDLAKHGSAVDSPNPSFSMLDHTVPSESGRCDEAGGWNTRFISGLRENSRRHGIRLFDLCGPEEGIVHVVGPELGLTLPRMTLVCGDSHTSTHGRKSCQRRIENVYVMSTWAACDALRHPVSRPGPHDAR